MKLLLLLCFVFGALGEQASYPELFAPGGYRLKGIPTHCEAGKLHGQIYDRGGSSLFLCKRYDDGTSYAEMISCKIGGIHIAVGHSVGNFRCTEQGMQKNGQYPSWVSPYARRGEKVGSRVFTTAEEIEEDRRQVREDRAEAKSAVDAAVKALEAAAATEVRPESPVPSVPEEPLPILTFIDPPTATTANPDCDQQTGECFYPTGQPGIRYPANPDTDSDKSRIPAGNPDCDELTQDCYFPNVPSAEPLPSTNIPTPEPTPIDIPTTTTPRPLPRSTPICTFNGKQAKSGQRFIVGDLYVLKCIRTGTRKTELRFAGCLTPSRGSRGNENHPKGFEGSLQHFDFPRHVKGSQFECRGEFVPNQLTVV